MDEVLFRSAQKLENLQMQFSLAASQSKDVLQQYSQQSKSAIALAWHSSCSERVRNNIHAFWSYFVNMGIKVRQQLWVYMDPQKIYYSLAKVFWQNWTKRDVCFLCAGIVCGSVIGVIFAVAIKKDSIRYMQAVQCTHYLGVESATVVENAKAPNDCSDNEVIIAVKAASVNRVDVRICSGYGKTLRKILQRIYNKHCNGDLPVTLGRDCTGIITDIGSNVKRLEIGDEVWVSVPFWFEGTLSQNVIIPEFRIARKPKNIGFEGACSLPYAGTLALNALKKAETNQDNALNRRFLILDGCTPVGCVLIQILKHWKAHITTTCTKRAMPVATALGAGDVIIYPEDVKADEESVSDCQYSFEKELQIRGTFDFVIVTKNCAVSSKFQIEKLSARKVISTLPEELYSDTCGFFSRYAMHSYIYVKSVLEKLLGVPLNDLDESHMCYVTLDILAEMVENGYLQTVVDKIFEPKDIEIALHHIQSRDSIGSTIITFK